MQIKKPIQIETNLIEYTSEKNHHFPAKNNVKKQAGNYSKLCHTLKQIIKLMPIYVIFKK